MPSRAELQLPFFPFAPIAISVSPVSIAVPAGVNVIALFADKAFAHGD
jgi:hypothetical protein